jgi:hypothetical protein
MMNTIRMCKVSIDPHVREGSDIDCVHQRHHHLSEEHLIMTIDPHHHRNTSLKTNHLERLHLHWLHLPSKKLPVSGVQNL